MTAAMFLIRAGLVLLFLFVLLYILIPDIFRLRKPESSLDDLEKQSKEFKEKKQAIRGATKKTQQKINNITKNIEK